MKCIIIATSNDSQSIRKSCADWSTRRSQPVRIAAELTNKHVLVLFRCTHSHVTFPPVTTLLFQTERSLPHKACKQTPTFARAVVRTREVHRDCIQHVCICTKHSSESTDAIAIEARVYAACSICKCTYGTWRRWTGGGFGFR